MSDQQYMKWQPIDTAPSDGTAVLVMCNDWPGTSTGQANECNGYNTYVAERWGDKWICYMSHIDDPECPIEPTHWMQLPKPPIYAATYEEVMP